MEIHYSNLSDTDRYIENRRGQTLEEKRTQYEGYMRTIRKFHNLTPASRILEVGTGTGWFPIQCKLDGYQCRGLEISPQLIEFARQFGARYNVEPDIELGNLEESDLGQNEWDVIVASNIFEHVEHWKQGVAKIHRGLKPGGMMFFESTNKFSFVSWEYKGIPLYGWLPDSARYALRKRVQGEEIMKLGIDFHQFRHGQLRREFERIGFSRILDRVELTEESWITTGFRRNVVRLSRSNPLVKALALTFAEATRFVCIK